MAQNLLQTLRDQYELDVSSSEEFRNGNTLMHVAHQVLYGGNNQFIESKLSEMHGPNKSTSPLANSNKTGNNVIIINSLLKHIKSDHAVAKPTWVQELTFYNLLENEDTLHKFISWMVQVNQSSLKQSPTHQPQNEDESSTLPMKHKKSLNPNVYQDMTEEEINSMPSNRFRNIQVDNARFKTQENQKDPDFHNLYFASNLKNKPAEDPIVISPEKGDKIVRKGSFKLLKPKVTFTGELANAEPKEFTEVMKKPGSHSKHMTTQNQTSKMSNFYQPDELKQISMIEPSNQQPGQNISQNINSSQYENFCQQNSSHIYQADEQFYKKNLSTTPLVNGKQGEVENRKTIPKNMSKPPLCRSSSRKNKQNMQNGASDKQKTVQQSLKKKNFFNFSHPEDLVSTFTSDPEPKMIFGRETSTNDNLQENYGSSSRSKQFAKIKELKSQQNNEIRQYMSLEIQGVNNGNVVEEDDYRIGSENEMKKKVNQDSSCARPGQESSQNSSKLLQLKNHFLQKQLYSLEKQITKEQNSLHELGHPSNEDLANQQQGNYQSGHKRSTTSLISQPPINKNTSFDSNKKSNRKVSKIHVHEVGQKDKQMIVDWLDSLHFVDKNKLNNHEEIFQKFKNGTKLVELCNHYIGRGKPLPYFCNPKKNAQIHSNYSKVFEYLKGYSQWEQPELLFAYELFVPYPQENSVWSLLLGMFRLLTKKGKAINKSASKQQPLICTKELESSRKRSVQKQFELLDEHSSKQNTIQKTKQIHQQKQQQKCQKSNPSCKKPSNFTKPVEFVRQIPEHLKHNDLVQQEEQNQSCSGSDQYAKQNEANMNVYFEGYKDRYMRKTLHNSSSKQKSKCASLQTPKKTVSSQLLSEQSFIYPYGQSLNKGSMRKSSSKKALQSQLKKIENSSCKLLNSNKSSQQQQQKQRKLPKVSLNMQMKVQKILKHFNLNNLTDQQHPQKLAKFQLLQDPIRNGTLVNMLLGKFLPSFQGKHIQSPKSIQHCRQNYLNVYAVIKNKYGQEGFQLVEKYLDFTEDILKGEKTLFYGVVYAIVQLMEKKGFNIVQQPQKQPQKQQQHLSESQPPNTYRQQKQKIQKAIQSFSNNPIEWIRYLQRNNPKVVSHKLRTVQDLKRSVTCGLFFYAFTENSSIKPVYMNPGNVEERQANLRKVISYLVPNKIAVDKDDFYNVRLIAQGSGQVMQAVVEKFVRYSVGKYGLGSYQQNGSLLVNDENQHKNIVNNLAANSQHSKPIVLSTYLQQHNHEHKNPSARLETTTAELINQTLLNNRYESHFEVNKRQTSKSEQLENAEPEVQIPWMRKLGFANCSLSINNGIIMCRLVSKLARTSINFNENITSDARISKAESLGYIRKAIKLIPSCKYDEIDIYEADSARTLQVYDMIKDKFRNTYELTKILAGK